jgi:hypothetical protein
MSEGIQSSSEHTPVALCRDCKSPLNEGARKCAKCGAFQDRSARLCRDCRSELNEGARKCTKCGAFQDWHCWIQSSQLLFGLISTILALQLIGPVKYFIYGNKPSVEAAIVFADAENVVVAVSNTGNGPALLEAITDIPDKSLRPGDIRVVTVPHHHRLPQVVEPGVVDDNAKSDGSLSVHYYEMGGNHVWTGDRFRCYIRKAQ